MEIQAMAAREVRGALSPFSYEPKPFAPFEIEIEITHCGVCHSDLHLVNNDWGISEYPLVPGHEIVGIVKAVGPSVPSSLKGTRVGVGWQRSACLQCSSCLAGDDNVCDKQTATCVRNFGGFATAIRVDSRYAFEIPEALDSENAAPLLCGGITVYNPLRTYEVNSAMRVGILGIGGLGHLALQFASKMGCEVVALSSTGAKEEEARRLGANEYVVTTDRSQLRKLNGSLDFILSTVSADCEWSSLMSMLKAKGRLCVVGASPNPIEIPAMALISGSRSISGSNIGSRGRIEEMLGFAARHGVKAVTERYKMADANQVFERLAANQVRYRAVLTN